MSSKYEVEVTITSAKDLKNINWRHGPIKPYVVLWINSDRKVATRVDEEGDTCPRWDQTLVIPLNHPIEDSTLYIDVVHAYAEEDMNPLIGSSKISLREIVDESGFNISASRTLKLKRQSGRPHGKLEVEVSVREVGYHAPEPYSAPPGLRYGGAQYETAPAGYSYGQPAYSDPGQLTYAGRAGSGYGYGQGVPVEGKSSTFGGMGTGLAVGAVAGMLGGVALVEGFDMLEDHVVDEAADQVEDDLDDGDYDCGDEFFF